MGERSNRPGIGLVTGILPDVPGGHAMVENLLHTLEPIGKEIFVVTGNYPQSAVFSQRIHLNSYEYDLKKQSKLIRIPKHVLLQLKICTKLVRIASKIEVVFFFVGAMTFILPIITAKLLRKRVVAAATGSNAQSARHQMGGQLFGVPRFVVSGVLAILESIDCCLAERIVVESQGMISSLGLNKRIRKVYFDSATYVDFNLFKINIPFQERKNLIGYIGRIDAEKGVLDFVRAIPLILEERDDVEFFIGGDGSLLDQVKNELKASGFYERATFTGWIAHEKLPYYMNEIKLIVAPSHTEGGIPAVIKEAMACGVSVIVSPVASGSINSEDKIAIILKDNSPEGIARTAVQALECKSSEEMINNANKYTKRAFSPENISQRYRDILYGENI